MAWLLRRGEVLASVQLARTPAERLLGLRACHDGSTVLIRRPAWSAHTFSNGRGVDLAWLDEHLVVRATYRLGPHALRFAHRGAHVALEAEAGAFDRWRLHPGDELEVKA